MRYLSLFSGIEAATAAWETLGWECVGVSEIEPFPCGLLAQKYPHVPNLGDVTAIDETAIAMLGRIDLIVFGSPCQDLSVAGKRKGLSGERSGLFHAAIRIIQWAREHCGLRWAVWENVPGAFSSNAGRDFAVVVGELAGLKHVGVPAHGWGNEGCAVGEHGMVEWSTLDAQWFGVAQRRRRCFAVADFGDWFGRQPILLEPYRLRGDSAPRREAGQGAAAGAPDGFGSGGQHTSTCRGIGDYASSSSSNALRASGADLGPGCEVLIAGVYGPGVAGTRNAGGHSRNPLDETLLAFNWNAQPDQMRFDPHVTALLTCSQESAVCITGHVTHTLKADGFDASEDGTGRGQPIVAYGISPDCFDRDGEGAGGTAGERSGLGIDVELAYSLRAKRPGGVATGMAVRRLTPMECERLQGFGDNYTNVTYRGKPAADGPRYKALGNSMAVPVMRWIGQQIDMVGLFQ